MYLRINGLITDAVLFKDILALFTQAAGGSMASSNSDLNEVKIVRLLNFFSVYGSDVLDGCREAT